MKITRDLPRLGVIGRQPLVWAAMSAALASSGPRGRRAAVRGSGCYLLAALVSNGLKPVFGRPQPRHRRVRKPQVMRGSFPSGHGAAEIAYTFGAAQEIHPTLLPFGALAILGHWSLVRAGKHYTSDMLGGKAMGLAVVALTARLWPPAGPTKGIPARLAGEPAEGGRELRRHAATPLTGG